MGNGELDRVNPSTKVLSLFNIILMSMACWKTLRFWAVGNLFSTISSQSEFMYETKLIFLALFFAMSFFTTIIGLIRGNFSKIDICIIILALITFLISELVIGF